MFTPTELNRPTDSAMKALILHDNFVLAAKAEATLQRAITCSDAAVRWTEDAYRLPNLQQKFIGGFSGFCWSHIPKARIQSFLRDFHRVFSSSAKVVFIDNAYVEGSNTPISRTDEHGDTYQLRRLDDGSTHEVLKNFPTELELRAAVEGLASDVQVEFLEYYWILSYVPRVDAS